MMESIRRMLLGSPGTLHKFRYVLLAIVIVAYIAQQVAVEHRSSVRSQATPTTAPPPPTSVPTANQSVLRTCVTQCINYYAPNVCRRSWSCETYCQNGYYSYGWAGRASCELSCNRYFPEVCGGSYSCQQYCEKEQAPEPPQTKAPTEAPTSVSTYPTDGPGVLYVPFWLAILASLLALADLLCSAIDMFILLSGRARELAASTGDERPPSYWTVVANYLQEFDQQVSVATAARWFVTILKSILQLGLLWVVATSRMVASEVILTVLICQVIVEILVILERQTDILSHLPLVSAVIAQPTTTQRRQEQPAQGVQVAVVSTVPPAENFAGSVASNQATTCYVIGDDELITVEGQQQEIRQAGDESFELLSPPLVRRSPTAAVPSPTAKAL